MKTTLFIATAVAVSLGASTVPMPMPSAHAESLPLESKDAMKAPGKPPTEAPGKSLTEATGKLNTDATKTKDDAKALDIEKTKQGAGLVQGDVKGLKDSAKGSLTNPLGK